MKTVGRLSLVFLFLGALSLPAGYVLAQILPRNVDGNIVVHVPPELVVREGIYMVAKEVTGKVTVNVDGKTYVGTLTFPDTKVRRTGVGRMQVDACVATGTVR